MLNGKDMIIHLIVKYFPKPYVSHVDVSNFALKSNLVS